MVVGIERKEREVLFFFAERAGGNGFLLFLCRLFPDASFF